jgi:hypothetical protein
VNDATNSGQDAPGQAQPAQSQPGYDGQGPWFDPGALAQPPGPEPRAVTLNRLYQTWRTGGFLAPGHEHLRADLDGRLAAELAARQRDIFMARSAVAAEDAAQRAADLATVPERPGLALADFLAAAPETPEMEVPGLMPKASRTIITGDEGTAGKSTLTRWIGGHHAAGIHPFTGEVYDGGVTVILDCENPPELIMMRLAELAEYLGDDGAALAAGRLVVDCHPAGIDLASPWWQEYLLRLVGGWQATLLITGPLYKMCAAHKPMSEEFFTAVSQFLDRLRDEHGCAEVIEAHNRQPVPGQAVRDPFPYGNTGWRRWPEAGKHLAPWGTLSDWRGNRWGSSVAWPVRLDRVPGAEVAWKAVYGGAAVADSSQGQAVRFEQIRAAVAADPGISLTKLRVAIGGDDGGWVRKAVEAGAVIEHKAAPGKANSYEVNPQWTGERLPAGDRLPDGRWNYAYWNQWADHGDPEG